jgi:hypothetical protein
MEKTPLPIEVQIEDFDYKINKNEAMSKRLAIVGISGLCISGAAALMEFFSNNPSDDRLGTITIAGILGIASLIASYNLAHISNNLKVQRDFTVFKKEVEEIGGRIKDLDIEMEDLGARIDTLESKANRIQYSFDMLWYGTIIEGEYIRLPDNLLELPNTTQSSSKGTVEFLLLTETAEEGSPTS